jgi:hypothetical protein
MTENEYKLLAVFEDRIHELIRLHETMKKSLKEKDEIIRRDKQTIEALKAKYTHLCAAHKLAGDDGEFQNARKRVNKLVREIDTCIALLIE